MKIKDEQQAALAAGLKRFHSDTRCKRCNGEVRYARTAACKPCQDRRTLAKKMRDNGFTL